MTTSEQPRIRLWELIEEGAFGLIAFHRPDGAIGAHITWIDRWENCLALNTDTRRFKYRMLQRTRTATVCVFIPDHPYEYFEVSCAVDDEILGDAAVAHLHSLSIRHRGIPYDGDLTHRVVVLLRPLRARG